jgi:hypothetical protein
LSPAEQAVLPRRESVREKVRFRGHQKVSSMHPTTIEVTTEEHLTENGDCIIGVAAAKGCAQLDQRIKDRLRTKDSRVTLRVIVGRLSFDVRARGDPRLELSHPRDIVIRKSDFASERTLAVKADAAAKDIPRKMVELLRNPETEGYIEIEVT